MSNQIWMEKVYKHWWDANWKKIKVTWEEAQDLQWDKLTGPGYLVLEKFSIQNK
jgi:hypothetical protein